ncbi:uncharacterized protein N7479_010445 [Penicillium vulpinum]|uniref:uncharacterized protein n=1 Tax=Penicillium vulpinum TaxID=29845 RepID=UPI002547D340|nr:uncharacterized protein N7479_010445 [Penicillium vulpinum]KAJ5952032.1 hypothetical protein N7479_010445 [Penicillium vulpinum]
MQDLNRAFPRPRHTRVMKPRSAGNSPSSVTRRRSTVNQNVMYGLPTQYQSSLEEALLASAARNSRPMSWHPSSARTRGLSNPYFSDFPSDSYSSMGTMSDQYLNPAIYTENIMSYPMTADPSFSPNDYFPIYSTMQEDMPLPQNTPTLMTGSQVDHMGWDLNSMSTDMSTMSHPASDNWNLDMLSMGTNIPPPETTCPSYVNVPSPGELSGPSTPDFLPIQQFEDPFQLTAELKKTGKEEELVGMGLYSQPNGTLARAPQSKLGEGLKLEETFTPSDEDKDSETDEIEIIEENELPQQQNYSDNAPTIRQSHFAPKQQPRQALNLRSFFFDHDDTDQQQMTATQPFAGFNQPCMNYGYGWI